MKESLSNIDKLMAAGDIKKAEILIAKLLRTQRFSANELLKSQLLLQRARVRLLSARPDDALDDLLVVRPILPEEFKEVALELLGDCYFARFELASVGFADRNDTTLAKQFYEEMIETHPRYKNLGWIYYQMGRVLVTASQTNEAMKCFQQALIMPSHVSVLTAYCYERLAFIAFYEQRDLDNALAFLNRAIDTYPATSDRKWLAQTHILRSRVLKGMGDYQSALNAAQTALSTLSANNGENKSILSEALLTYSGIVG